MEREQSKTSYKSKRKNEEEINTHTNTHETKREIKKKKKQPHAEHKPWQSQVLVVQPPNRMNQESERERGQKPLNTEIKLYDSDESELMLDDDAIAAVTLV